MLFEKTGREKTVKKRTGEVLSRAAAEKPAAITRPLGRPQNFRRGSTQPKKRPPSEIADPCHRFLT
jgi:hypothetical protein